MTKSEGKAQMPNELPLPPDLQHLIEKRDEPDRRGNQSSEEPAATCGNAEGESEELGELEEVSGDERQTQPGRRKEKRRQNDC